LIKGVAGRILWKLLKIQTATGRTDFSNKEIRLDGSLNLPDFKDNLESRLILLRRRLEEHCDFLILSRVGRGQIRLDVRRRLTLEELP
jgi:adenylate cyclase